MSEDMKNDPLLARYREASAQEQAEPSARVREAVLARAAALADTHAREKARPKNEAANDGAWRWKIAASVAVIGFTGMIARHHIEAPPAERVETRAAASGVMSDNATASDVSKNKVDSPLSEIAAAAPPLQPFAMPAPLPNGLAKEQADFRARATPTPTASPARPTPAQTGSLVQKSIPSAAPRREQTSAPEPTVKAPAPQSPPTEVIENKIAVVPDQVASVEGVRRRQPEMSTGDRPLAAPNAPVPAPTAAPIAAAPIAKIDAAPAPQAPSSEASLAAPITAPAPSPSASAQIAASPALRAPTAPVRVASGLAMPTEPALIAAIRNGDSESLRVQLAAGANANSVTRDGTSALMLAAQRGRSDDVAALLRSGANVNARDAQGRTALSAALAQGHTDIAAMLRAAGAAE